MDLIELLRGKLDTNFIQQLSQDIDEKDPEQTEAAASGIISTLIAGLSNNVAQPGGDTALVSAIERDHDGSILDDLGGFIFGNKDVGNPKTLNGAGILDHIFGGKKSKVQDMVGNATGMDKSKIMKLMITLAPLVLAAIGKAKNRQQSQGSQGGFNVRDLLSGTVQAQNSQGNDIGILERFLDKDGDGSVMDDIANMGMKAFLNRR
ncbi:MAG: DUF937 domain-containing protein [Bacteroidota bacterium]|nr:DUF937 domain-containing protein [Bacteroidota bacterium]